MALTKERCNEIAWKYLVKEILKPMISFPEISLDLSSEINDSKVKDIAFAVLVAIKFKSGIKIGQLTKRQIGNEAKSVGISSDEAMEFAKSVVNEIVKRMFK